MSSRSLWCQTADERLSWLRSFVRTQFHSPCPRHGSRYSKSNLLSFYCTNCMSDPFCSSCQDEHTKHEGHQVLQVRRASEHSAVEVHDINKLWDTSGIREYHINKKRIFHLYSRQIKVHTYSSKENCCKICDWKLNPEDIFCSIECKLLASFQDEEMEPSKSKRSPTSNTSDKSPSQQSRKMDVPVEVDTSNKLHNQQTSKSDADVEANISNSFIPKDSVGPAKSSRRWRRKGIPRHSPYF